MHKGAHVTLECLVLMVAHEIPWHIAWHVTTYCCFLMTPHLYNTKTFNLDFFSHNLPCKSFSIAQWKGLIHQMAFPPPLCGIPLWYLFRKLSGNKARKDFTSSIIEDELQDSMLHNFHRVKVNWCNKERKKKPTPCKDKEHTMSIQQSKPPLDIDYTTNQSKTYRNIQFGEFSNN